MFRNVKTASFYVISKTLHRYSSTKVKSSPWSEQEILRSTILKRECYEDLINLVHRNSFPTEDVRKPMAIGLNVTDLYGEFLPRFLDENFSRICYDAPTGQAVGVIVNRVVKENSCLSPLKSVYPGANAILSSLQTLESQGDIFSYGATSGMQILYLAVLEPYRGKGIGKLLVSETVRSARKNRLDFLQTFAVQPEIHSFFAGLGFKTVSKLNMKDHYVEGSLAFPNATLDDELSCLVKFV